MIMDCQAVILASIRDISNRHKIKHKRAAVKTTRFSALHSFQSPYGTPHDLRLAVFVRKIK